MEITFLGTSAGTPTATRNMSAVALRYGSGWDLFDCAEGTQHQLLPTSLSLPKLRRIFISHLHGDHCFGIFGLLGSRSMSGCTTPLTVYGPAGIEAMVRHVLEASDSHVGFPLEFHEVASAGERVVEDDDEVIDAIALDHRIESFAWCIRESERPGVFYPEKAIELGVEPGPAFQRLRNGESVPGADGDVSPDQVIGPARKGRSLIISGDNRDPARLLEATGHVQLLVHESTFTEEVLEHLGDDRGHSTAHRVAEAGERAGINHLLLTHFSPRYGPTEGGGPTVEALRSEALKSYSGNLDLADDYATYTLTLDGELLKA